MTQVEFENEMRNLRVQKGIELNVIAKMQGEVKELNAEREKLNQQRLMLGQTRLTKEQEWGKRIKDFYDQHYTTTRELENVSEWAIVNELRHRGFNGTLINPVKDEEFMSNLNAKLNGSLDTDCAGQ